MILWLVKQKQVYRDIQNPIGLMRIVINFLLAKILYKLSIPHSTALDMAKPCSRNDL